jgi:hypothetical protein
MKKITLVYSGFGGKVKVKEVDFTKELVKLGVSTILITNVGHVAFANSFITTTPSISKGLQPLIDVLKDLAEPVSYGFMIKGFMKVMSGDEHEGMKIVKYSAGGFIGIQWIPYIFSIIKGIRFQ